MVARIFTGMVPDAFSWFTVAGIASDTIWLIAEAFCWSAGVRNVAAIPVAPAMASSAICCFEAPVALSSETISTVFTTGSIRLIAC